MEKEPATQLPEDLVALNDPELSDQALLKLLERRIQERRQQLGIDRRRFPKFGMAAPPDLIPDISDPDLHQHMHLLYDSFDTPKTELNLADSPSTRLPVVGRLWKTIRNQAHDLVLFYVNRYVGHEVEVNRNIVSVLNLLVRVSDEHQREIEDLRARLEALRKES
jgi:hypothetical protein